MDSEWRVASTWSILFEWSVWKDLCELLYSAIEDLLDILFCLLYWVQGLVVHDHSLVFGWRGTWRQVWKSLISRWEYLSLFGAIVKIVFIRNNHRSIFTYCTVFDLVFLDVGYLILESLIILDSSVHYLLNCLRLNRRLMFELLILGGTVVSRLGICWFYIMNSIILAVVCLIGVSRHNRWLLLYLLMLFLGWCTLNHWSIKILC